MDSGDVAKGVALIILLALSAFFSSAETAMMKANKIKLKNMADEGNRRAAKLLSILEDNGKLISAILIGNNIVNIAASSLATIIATEIWGNAGAGIATGALTILVLIFGEITPKTAAAAHADGLAMTYYPFVAGWMKVATPLIFLMNFLAGGILRLMGIKPSSKTAAYTPDEIRTIVEASMEDGVLDSEEHEIINNLFDFGDGLAKDIMVPRADMSVLDINSSYADIIERYSEDEFTRYPIFEESTDNIVGMINVKDLLKVKDTDLFKIRDIMREVGYTYEHKKIFELLTEIKKSPTSIIIVLDEYGATTGMITKEDLVEELVGDIRDEYDESEEELVKKLSDNEYIVEGALKLDDLNDYFDFEDEDAFESEDYDSIGGLIIELLEHLPEKGEEAVTDKGVRLIVDELDKNRIDKVRIIFKTEE